MSTEMPGAERQAPQRRTWSESEDQVRELAEVSAVELVSTVAVHLLSAAALRCGLAEEGEEHQEQKQDTEGAKRRKRNPRNPMRTNHYHLLPHVR